MSHLLTSEIMDNDDEDHVLVAYVDRLNKFASLI